VALSGQIDYPAIPKPQGGFPLVFILQHAGCNTRDCYDHYAALALECGYAVFRWDKRGTGRSGAGGRGSTTQDAVYAYETAVSQDHINPRRTIILAQGAGTGLLGSSFGLFARVQPPYRVILISNLLDEEAILAIEAPLHIIMSDNDWNPWDKYAEAACAAHNAAYSYGATYYVAENSDRTLSDLSDPAQGLHRGARDMLQEWLSEAHPARQLLPPTFTRLNN